MDEGLIQIIMYIVFGVLFVLFRVLRKNAGKSRKAPKSSPRPSQQPQPQREKPRRQPEPDYDPFEDPSEEDIFEKWFGETKEQRAAHDAEEAEARRQLEEKQREADAAWEAAQKKYGSLEDVDNTQEGAAMGSVFDSEISDAIKHGKGKRRRKKSGQLPSISPREAVMWKELLDRKHFKV